MSQVAKVFLLLIIGYLVVKGVFLIVFYVVTKRVQQKGFEYKRKRAEIRQNQEKDKFL